MTPTTKWAKATGLRCTFHLQRGVTVPPLDVPGATDSNELVRPVLDHISIALQDRWSHAMWAAVLRNKKRGQVRLNGEELGTFTITQLPADTPLSASGSTGGAK